MDEELTDRMEAYKGEITESLAAAFPETWDAGFLDKIVARHEYVFDERAFTDVLGKPFWNYMNRGGKRWRPFLLSVVGRMFSVDDRILKTFLAFPEMIHNGSIVIDDIEDGGTIRRGEDALHLVFGTDVAINLGNLMYFMSLTVLRRVEDSLSEKTQLRIYRAYSDELVNVHLGQGLDIAWHKDSKRIPTEDQYLQMCAFKTGTLARLSGRLGIILAGEDEEMERKMGRVLEKAGVAFQIQDDILDVRNSLSFNEGFGKQAGNDFREGKKTLVLIRGLRSVSEKDRDRILAGLGRKDLPDEEVKWIATALYESGAVDSCLEFAKTLISDAWSEIKSELPEGEDKDTLERFFRYLTEREI